MGRGEERVMAQPIQKAPHKVRKETRELSWSSPTRLLPDGLSENNFGVGSEESESIIRLAVLMPNSNLAKDRRVFVTD